MAVTAGVCENEKTADQRVNDMMAVVQYPLVASPTCLHCHYQIKFDVCSQKTGTNGKSHHDAGGMPHSCNSSSVFIAC